MCSWTAVCRGAVIRGLVQTNIPQLTAISIDKRIARASYGTLYNALPFDSERDDAADRVWCDIHQDFLAVEQTCWFLEIVS